MPETTEGARGKPRNVTGAYAVVSTNLSSQRTGLFVRSLFSARRHNVAKA